MRRIEGTFRLEGLVEGRVPADGGEARLRDWVGAAASAGLGFRLELDGTRFGLLADGRPQRAAALGPSPAATVKSALEELARAYDPGENAELFSTLRSVEVVPGQEVQTVYLIGPGGAVEVRERAIDADTARPPAGGALAERARRWAPTALIVLVLAAASTLVIDYPALWAELKASVTALDTKALKIETGPFARWVKIDAVAAKGRDLLVVLRRTDAFPEDDPALARALADTDPTPRARLALEALARGYVRVEYFDADGSFLGAVTARTAGLRERDTTPLRLPAFLGRRPARLALVP